MHSRCIGLVLACLIQGACSLTTLVRFSVQEIRRLLLALWRRTLPSVASLLHWSHWRRHSQAVARQCHDRGRGTRLKLQR